MAIYGTAILSACLVTGLLVGDLFGVALGVNRNVGGVGIGMLLLIVICDRLQRSGKMTPPTEQGVLFWSAVYIPIVVAMAATRNVVTAVSGGWLAVVAGIAAVVVSFALVPVLSRFDSSPSEKPEDETTDDANPLSVKESP